MNDRQGYRHIRMDDFMVAVHDDRPAYVTAAALGIETDFVLQLRRSFPNTFKCSTKELLSMMDHVDAFRERRCAVCCGVLNVDHGDGVCSDCKRLEKSTLRE